MEGPVAILDVLGREWTTPSAAYKRLGMSLGHMLPEHLRIHVVGVLYSYELRFFTRHGIHLSPGRGPISFLPLWVYRIRRYGSPVLLLRRDSAGSFRVSSGALGIATYSRGRIPLHR